MSWPIMYTNLLVQILPWSSLKLIFQFPCNVSSNILVERKKQFPTEWQHYCFNKMRRWYMSIVHGRSWPEMSYDFWRSNVDLPKATTCYTFAPVVHLVKLGLNWDSVLFYILAIPPLLKRKFSCPVTVRTRHLLFLQNKVKARISRHPLIAYHFW